MPEDAQEVRCDKDDDNEAEDLVHLHYVHLLHYRIALALDVFLDILFQLRIVVITDKLLNPLNVEQLKQSRHPEQLHQFEEAHLILY